MLSMSRCAPMMYCPRIFRTGFDASEAVTADGGAVIVVRKM
jgi:hypothetical protein